MPRNRDGIVPGGVLFAAYTGKAALVMTRKGTPASTIHSLIYRVSEAHPKKSRGLKKEAADLRASIGSLPPAEQLFAMERLKRLELRLADIHQPRFVLNRTIAVRDARAHRARRGLHGGTTRWRATCCDSANRS